MPNLARLRRLSRRDLVLLARALRTVAQVRAYLWLNRHHQLRRRIDRITVPQAGPVPRAELAAVAWSVRAAARLVPGATCLTQASAGQLLLARRGHASTVRLSVPARPGPDGKLAPHAWLMADEMIVLGGSSANYAAHRMLHDYTLPGHRPAPAAETGRPGDDRPAPAAEAGLPGRHRPAPAAEAGR